MARKKGLKKKQEIVDERFLAAASRPQFRKSRQEITKVVLDNRFAAVLTDDRFRLDEKDKYGRRKENRGARNELDAFYTVEKEEKKADDTVHDDNLSDEGSSSDESQKEAQQDPSSRIAYLTALSRGELSLSSSSDENESDSSDDDDESKVDVDSTTRGILDPSGREDENVSVTAEASKYLAVLNMDWTHVRSVDLFAILSSFTGPGSLKKLQIFPSDFGLDRMAKEDKFGPSDIWKKNLDQRENDNDSTGDQDDGNQSDRSFSQGINPNAVDSDFDPEKLRAYETSKLKYFFAVAEFTSSAHADVAYREVDGLELEHSSAAIDLRSIPERDIQGVTQGRKLRDEALAVPTNYEPPNFVVSALQQTSVQCTWEGGDAERERKLTAYGNRTTGGWGDLAETDDLRVYLASDVSSSDANDSDSDNEQKEKGQQMRRMLGLESDRDGIGSCESDTDDDDADASFSREVTFVPGKTKLADTIRSKIEPYKKEKEQSPWEKYQEKRKQKKKERKQEARSRRREKLRHESDDDVLAADPEVVADGVQEDTSEIPQDHREQVGGDDEKGKLRSRTTEELELILGCDNDEEARDYNMRGLARMEKNKDKKLRGFRKRKEDKLATNVTGIGFKIDKSDERFAAVLDGTDPRFGIDRTDPNYKETPAMREILSAQTKRRKAKKAKRKHHVVPDISADSNPSSSHQNNGAIALSELVNSLKSKISKT